MLPTSSWGEGDLIDDEVRRVETTEQKEGGREQVTMGRVAGGRLRAESSQLVSR